MTRRQFIVKARDMHGRLHHVGSSDTREAALTLARAERDDARGDCHQYVIVTDDETFVDVWDSRLDR